MNGEASAGANRVPQRREGRVYKAALAVIDGRLPPTRYGPEFQALVDAKVLELRKAELARMGAKL